MPVKKFHEGGNLKPWGRPAHIEETSAHPEESFAHVEEKLAHPEESFARPEEGMHTRRKACACGD